MCKRPVGVIFGGRSAEHEVSCESAAFVMKTLNRDKYDCLYIGITKEGQWKLFKGTADDIRGDWTEKTEDFSINELKEKVGFVLPVLHGPYGEDGTLQGLLEILDIPYGGCGVLASALAMDKATFKELLRAEGLPVCRNLTFCREQIEEGGPFMEAAVEEALGFPCFVKPSNMGSSVGISKVTCGEELLPALGEAARYDSKVLVEEFIPGREIEVALLGNYIIEASFPGEIVPAKDFYDYEAKYSCEWEPSKPIIPAALPEETCRNLQKLAISAFKAIGGEGFGRVDFFMRKSDGHIYINEVNTIPGLTERSMFPLLWQAQGKTPEGIIERIIDLGYERYYAKNRR